MWVSSVLVNMLVSVRYTVEVVSNFFDELRNVSLKSFSAEEKVYFKQHMHTEENLYCLS